MNFRITWDDNLINPFIQGSKISFDEINEIVNFTNLYFSAGSSIIKWNSNIVYSSSRTLVQLPLLKKGKEYLLKTNYDLEPKNSILVKINFYNRTGYLLSTSPLRCEGGRFVYPLNAYSYEIELISTGMSEMNFREIILSEEQN